VEADANQRCPGVTAKDRPARWRAHSTTLTGPWGPPLLDELPWERYAIECQSGSEQNEVDASVTQTEEVCQKHTGSEMARCKIKIMYKAAAMPKFRGPSPAIFDVRVLPEFFRGNYCISHSYALTIPKYPYRIGAI